MADGLSVGNLSVSGGLARLTGASSKLDTEAIVAAAYEAKRLPAVRFEHRISRNEARAAALGELKSLLGTLKSAVNGLRNPPGLLAASEDAFESRQAFLSAAGGTRPEELLGISLENGVPLGSFSVEVERLATAHKLAANATGGADQTLADAWNAGASFSGSLRIGLAGGPAATIAVMGAMDIQDLRAAINAASAQTSVEANVLAVSGGDHRLVLTAATTGKAIELADAGGDSVTALLGASEIQPAQTSRVVVDGVAVERAGNRVDDLMAGVTIDLYRAEPGTAVGVQVEPSLAAAKEQITGFVAAYNALRDFVAKHAAVSTGGEVAEDAVLFGDRTLRSVAQTLGDLVGGATAGLDSAALGTLRDVGISLESGGRLRVDERTLDARLPNKLDEVRRVFEFTATASSGDLRVHARTNALTDLSFTVAISDPDADGTPDAATIDGVPAVVSGRTITGADGTAYEGLKLIWAGQGDASIGMQVSQGVADRLHNALDEALDLFDGPVQRAIDGLGEANRGYAEQVERIEARAAAARERLIERFTAMEAALSVANAMLAQVRTQMDAMNGES
jgi:flagellar hook-associated protein 2